MINVGDLVFILPHSSLRFAKRWGKVVEIVPTSPTPLRVLFPGSAVTYRFSQDEVLTKEAHLSWAGQTIFCQKCGKDITGQYTYICEDCAYPLPQDGDQPC